jgi:glycosyltransferase involved in cell wall biosynthesis
MGRPRILFVVNDAPFFVSHRLALGIGARDAGYDVHVATPPGAAVAKILEQGLSHHEIRINRSGRNPWREAKTIEELRVLYARLAPDIVHHVTPKPILYGSIAARLARVPGVVNAVSGLGYVFLAPGARAALIRAGVRSGYRFAFANPNSRTIFQNDEDRAIFLEPESPAWRRSVLIRGSGVDTKRFAAKAEPGGDPLVLLPSRMLRDKGVVEFVQAARALRGRGVRARFVLVGDSDPGNPAAIPRAELEAWQREGVVEWWGFRNDMPQVLAAAHVVCLPSYREGLPLALVEAAASGRPIVTTDAPGCREIVKHGQNGLLVPPRDADALAGALMKLIVDAGERAHMGARGRQMVEAEFSIEHVLAATLSVYRDLTATRSSEAPPRTRASA